MTKRYAKNPELDDLKPIQKKHIADHKNQSDDKENLHRYIKDGQMIDVLSKKGIKKLFPIQYSTFDIIYKGQDIVAKDRTGSGKTMAFTLPVIRRLREKKAFSKEHKPKFLVILPTRQLTLQVHDEIRSLRLTNNKDDYVVGAIYGGQNMSQQIEMIQKGVDILVATPGRLIDFINRGLIDFKELQVTCLDEADQMLNMGFKPDIQQVFKYIKEVNPQKTQNLLFSATIPEWIWSISQRYQQKNRPFIDLIKNSATQTSTTVEHFSLKSTIMEKQLYLGPLIDYFLKDKIEKRVIIFCQTKREVERIGSLNVVPLSTGTLHGDVKQLVREKVFRDFKTGKLQCIVATNVAARGLDFPQIDLIIQMQPPRSSDTYIHRSGRTGRAGKKGICATIFSFKEQSNLKNIEFQSKITFCSINPSDLKKYEPKSDRPAKTHDKHSSSTSYRNNNITRQQSGSDGYGSMHSKFTKKSDPYDIKRSNGSRRQQRSQDLDY